VSDNLLGPHKCCEHMSPNTILKNYDSTGLAHLMRLDGARSEPYEYLDVMSKLVTDLLLLIRQMNADQINPRTIEPTQQWKGIKLDLKKIFDYLTQWEETK